MSRKQSQTDIQERLTAELEQATRGACTWTHDVQENIFGWLSLSEPEDLLPAAAVLSENKARLVTITAYAEERGDQDKKRSIAYHFVIDAVTITVTIPIYNAETLESLPVPSITSFFRNADWNEREFHEMYDIEIIDHPNPKRLFLDEKLDAGIMSSLIPFSTMVHGAGSQGLWEKVMEEKAGHTPSLAHLQEEIVEPEFTPVEHDAPPAADATAKE